MTTQSKRSAVHKRNKLQSSGIQFIPEPDCEAAGNENIMAVIDRVGRLMTPEAEAAGLPLPKGDDFTGNSRVW
ncbi:MAG: hypothetical protein HC852_22625 [Acaryochloridaceae cyanobacterium RU_4_10]|nr:hypothetical protein [Acaryochloridaceae cyanobacterium RU_4_10]